MIRGRVVTDKGAEAIVNARVTLSQSAGISGEGIVVRSDKDGYFSFHPPAAGDSTAPYTVTAEAFGNPSQSVYPKSGEDDKLPDLVISVGTLEFDDEAGHQIPIVAADSRMQVKANLNLTDASNINPIQWKTSPIVGIYADPAADKPLLVFVPRSISSLSVTALISEKLRPLLGGINSPTHGSGGNPGDGQNGYANDKPVLPASTVISNQIDVLAATATPVSVTGGVTVQNPVNVTLNRSGSDPTLDQGLWAAILNRTEAISFNAYKAFMDQALATDCGSPLFCEDGRNQKAINRMRPEMDAFGSVDIYDHCRTLTDVFLVLQCGVRIDPNGRHGVPFDLGEDAYRYGQPVTLQQLQQRLAAYVGKTDGILPYLDRVLRAIYPDLERDGFDGRLIGASVNSPCMMELIHSYFIEQSGLVQGVNAVLQRFHNFRGENDVLRHLQLDPLRSLGHFLWGWGENQYKCLTVARRSAEYRSEYGLKLCGRATAGLRTAESRSRFLDAFENLLYRFSVFFTEDNDTTRVADGYVLLAAIKELHVTLAYGMGNQMRSLTFKARAEMLLMQYIMASNQMREFLQVRYAVPTLELWEAPTDTMNSIQGWNDVPVGHYRDLARYAEKVVLAARYGDWIGVNDENSAKNLARAMHPEIVTLINAYRAVTGIDVTRRADREDSAMDGGMRSPRASRLRSRLV